MPDLTSIFFSITPEGTVTVWDIAERVKAARVESQWRARSCAWTLPSAPDAFWTNPFRKNIPWIIWQSRAGDFQFSQSAVVIEACAIKMPCSCVGVLRRHLAGCEMLPGRAASADANRAGVWSIAEAIKSRS